MEGRLCTWHTDTKLYLVHLHETSWTRQSQYHTAPDENALHWSTNHLWAHAQIYVYVNIQPHTIAETQSQIYICFCWAVNDSCMSRFMVSAGLCSMQWNPQQPLLDLLHIIRSCCAFAQNNFVYRLLAGKGRKGRQHTSYMAYQLIIKGQHVVQLLW